MGAACEGLGDAAADSLGLAVGLVSSFVFAQPLSTNAKVNNAVNSIGKSFFMLFIASV